MNDADPRVDGSATTRRVALLCYGAAALIVAYWVAWFARRSLVATSTTPTYLAFEQAFPLADGFIVVALVAGARALARGSSRAVLFLLLGAGAGFYLGAMDVLYDLEHGVWAQGANGLVELTINVVTFAAATSFARWVWRARRRLDPVSDDGPSALQ
ncbi:MAG: hypothetical protein KGJ10_05345 [Acidobacteriota bacterium]|nr:hypothetical protein [Acidobacteriota bacterium]